jgi:hypothetical protein
MKTTKENVKLIFNFFKMIVIGVEMGNGLHAVDFLCSHAFITFVPV